MSSLFTLKSNQNDEISTNEKDNRNSQKHNNNESSRKRDEPEDEGEADHENVQSSANKKARVSVTVASLPPEPEPEPEPGLGQVVELPASFNTLDDDCLGNVLDFVGKKCYSAFGRIDKRCHEMFCLKGLKKETYWYGYAPLRLIQQKERKYSGIAKGVFHYNRRDIFEWILADESNFGQKRLKHLCFYAIIESRLDILREVFQRANLRQLESLRDCDYYDGMLDLCETAAETGKLECLKFLRENECEWGDWTWIEAQIHGQEHILDYLRNNGYPTEWQK